MLSLYFCYKVFQLISQSTRYFENNIIKLRFALLITGNVIFFTLNSTTADQILDVLDEILNLIGSVSEGFPSYSFLTLLNQL